MKKIGHYTYTVIFYISRVFSVLALGTGLFIVLQIKYAISERYFYFLFDFIFRNSDTANINFFNININFFEIISFLFIAFCKNSQIIDLLLIALAVVLIISILTIKFINNKHKYLLTTSIISSVIYIVMYLIFSQPIMIALAIATPIIYILIQLSNKICPIQKLIMLIPIIGEILCTKNIIKHIFKNSSDKFKQISLLIVALIVSNIICFLFQYKTDKDFENRIMDNWTYSIRSYQDKLIISGDRELITINKDDTITHTKNDKFDIFEDFIVDKNKKQLYFCNFGGHELLIINSETLNIISNINIISDKNDNGDATLCCNENISKLLVIYEYLNIGCLLDLNTHAIRYIKNVAPSRDCLIYNKNRNSFLLSFYEDNSFLEEIDIENKKIRKIKADKYQGYLAISERNKEIYVAFLHQGRIGIYDAETMKLKRKIKTNYTVKDITYDEELNILIAPSYFTGYVDIFLMDGSDKLLTREFVGYELREGCFDHQKENLYVCSMNGLYKKEINIKKLIEQNSNVSHETKN